MTATPLEVSFLWRRAAFGMSADGADDRAGRSWDQLVAELVDPEPAPMPAVPGATDAALDEADRIEAAIAAWLDHMATTPTPGAEKLTWFWHNHFATSARKVPDAAVLLRQLGVLRAGATGSFRALLEDVVLDSAMCLFLDNNANRVGAINENLGRELLEVFTVGPGIAGESDVVAAARCLTGYGVEAGTRLPRFDPAAHDHGTKTILGVTGDLDGPGLFDVLTTGDRRVAVARRIAGRLWRQWAHEQPTSALVDHLVAAVIDGDLSGRAFARAVLLHPEFRSARTRTELVRTPVEVVVAVAKAVGLPAATLGSVSALRRAGHCPYQPPHVGGWPLASALRNPASWWAEATVHLRALRAMLDAPSNPFESMAALPPEVAARAALRHAGIVEASLPTVLSLALLLARRQQTSSSGFPHSAWLGAVFAPEFVASL